MISETLIETWNASRSSFRELCPRQFCCLRPNMTDMKDKVRHRKITTVIPYGSLLLYDAGVDQLLYHEGRCQNRWRQRRQVVDLFTRGRTVTVFIVLHGYLFWVGQNRCSAEHDVAQSVKTVCWQEVMTREGYIRRKEKKYGQRRRQKELHNKKQNFQKITPCWRLNARELLQACTTTQKSKKCMYCIKKWCVLKCPGTNIIIIYRFTIN